MISPSVIIVVLFSTKLELMPLIFGQTNIGFVRNKWKILFTDNHILKRNWTERNICLCSTHLGDSFHFSLPHFWKQSNNCPSFSSFHIFGCHFFIEHFFMNCCEFSMKMPLQIVCGTGLNIIHMTFYWSTCTLIISSMTPVTLGNKLTMAHVQSRR
jgi:hypothetical protein